MAKKVSVLITDDIDGSAEAEPVQFSVNGQNYEIDLGPAHRTQLHDSLRPFIDAARRTAAQKASQTRRARADLADIRAWASDQGLNVAERGRISGDVIRQYEAAH
jgi:hypothetical protein